MKTAPSKRRLIEVVNRIRIAKQGGQPLKEFLDLGATIAPGADLDNLCDSDWPPEVIATYCLGLQKASKILSRDELLELVRSIRRGPLSDEGQDSLRLRLFSFNCVHPSKTDLFFYPELVVPDRDRFTDEEIVTLAAGGKLE